MPFYNGPEQLAWALPVKAGESLRSWLSRIADINTTPRRKLWGYPSQQGFWYEGLHRLKRSDLYPIARACSVPVEDILAMRPDEHDLPLRTTAVFCPRCWQTDLSLGMEHIHQRASWCRPLSLVCRKHKAPIIDRLGRADPASIRAWVTSPQIEAFLSQQKYWEPIASRFLAIETHLLGLEDNTGRSDALFAIMDTIHTALQRTFSAAPCYSAQRELYFRLSNEKQWSQFWPQFFADPDEQLTYHHHTHRHHRLYYKNLLSASARRFYFLTIASMVRHPLTEDHPHRPCFNPSAWQWLLSESEGWPKRAFQDARKVSQLMLRRR